MCACLLDTPDVRVCKGGDLAMMPPGEQPFGEWLALRHAHAHAGICLAKNKIKNASHIKHGMINLPQLCLPLNHERSEKRHSHTIIILSKLIEVPVCTAAKTKTDQNSFCVQESLTI